MNSKNNEDLKTDSVYIDFETVFLMYIASFSMPIGMKCM
jgi:hypothetical protein